jgi:hypothetical protein
MLPRRRHPKSNPSLFGVRERPSGRFAAELTADGQQLWFGTFEIAELAVCAHDALAWWLRGHEQR